MAYIAKSKLFYDVPNPFRKPSQSPVLSTIQLLWDLLKWIIRKHVVTSKEMLKFVIAEERKKITTQETTKIFESLPNTSKDLKNEWNSLKIINFLQERSYRRISRINDSGSPTHELWFQQDGATCHTACATIDLLKDTFGDRLISRFGPVNWPPRSCDLTPLDYFLWGYVKSLVYADKPQTLDHLEDNIRRVIADIRPQMLEKVIENWTSRLDYI
ncbi:putative LOC100569746 [Trichonephila clavipes]|nr:putative LOC100569746 [Trichonephila clavipes]